MQENAQKEIIASRTLYLFSLLLPIALLGVSFVVTPHLFSVSKLRKNIEPLPGAPILLYRRHAFAVYYTSRDLLHPEAFGKPGQYYQAVVFDVWPANEGNSAAIQSLTWIRQIYWAFNVQDQDGNPLPDAHATVVDQNLADDFLRKFVGPPKLERKSVLSLLVPAESTYGRGSGIELLVAMAVKNPEEKRFYPNLKDTPQLFAPSLQLALEAVAERKLTGVGVPFIPTSGLLGRSAPQSSSCGGPF